MDLDVFADGRLAVDGQIFPCILGRAGVVEAAYKTEGDGATPAGIWPLRRLLYRADRVPRPKTGLTAVPIKVDDGWCNDPADPAYNQPVKCPSPASHEVLWREDRLYDLIVILGHNDDPPMAERGSAIFMHLAHPARTPTAGCVALAEADLLAVLARADSTSRIIVHPAD